MMGAGKVTYGAFLLAYREEDIPQAKDELEKMLVRAGAKKERIRYHVKRQQAPCYIARVTAKAESEEDE